MRMFTTVFLFGVMSWVRSFVLVLFLGHWLEILCLKDRFHERQSWEKPYGWSRTVKNVIIQKVKLSQGVADNPLESAEVIQCFVHSIMLFIYLKNKLSTHFWPMFSFYIP